jgi:hypothetical protein
MPAAASEEHGHGRSGLGHPAYHPHGVAIDRIGEFHRRRKDSSSSGSAQAVERLLGYSPGQPGPIMKVIN